jgi:hypothetical protein
MQVLDRLGRRLVSLRPVKDYSEITRRESGGYFAKIVCRLDGKTLYFEDSARGYFELPTDSVLQISKDEPLDIVFGTVGTVVVRYSAYVPQNLVLRAECRMTPYAQGIFDTVTIFSCDVSEGARDYSGKRTPEHPDYRRFRFVAPGDEDESIGPLDSAIAELIERGESYP